MEKHEFGLWIRPEGYIYEFTAPDTPSENGPAERVIMRKARAMRIEAKMPSNIWPRFFKTAIYITNRTPTRQLEWMTPLEVLYRHLDKPSCHDPTSREHSRG